MGGTHHCDDADLGKMLHQLFVLDGETEVEIHHPTDGVVVYTKEQWEASQKQLKRVMEMSPAERYQEHKRIERQQQVKFRTALVTAESRTVDIEDDDNFGKDVKGEDIPMDGMTFIAEKDYPKGTMRLESEIGCFMDETMRRPPIRILTQ